MIKTKTKNLLLIALIPTFLTACTLVPGSHMEGVGYTADTSQLESDLEKVNIRIIDSKLVNEQQLKLKNQRSLSKNRDAVNVSHYKYKVGIGDVLSIGVWDHPELTIPAAVQRTAAFDGFRIQDDGTITYAYTPKLYVEGKTIIQIHDALVASLSKIIESPQVDVKVVGFNSQKVYVTGEVKKPGTLPVTEIPLTLIDALNQAGGLTEKADWRDVAFVRDGKAESIKVNELYTKGDVSQNRLLMNGDVIHINRMDRQNVFVLGDVANAKSIEINRYGLSLAEAISEVGGINEATADANGIFVMRKRDLVKDGVIADVYQLHAKNAVAFILANEFQLQPHDIVYVTTAPIARWNRLISQLLPTITIVDKFSEIKARGNIF